MQGSGDECSDGQAVRKRYGEHIMTGSFNCADPDKDERKCSNKFGDTRTKFFHPPIEAKTRAKDNCVISGENRNCFYGSAASVIGISLMELVRDAIGLVVLSRFLISFGRFFEGARSDRRVIVKESHAHKC